LMTFDFIPIKKLNTYYMIIIFLVVFFLCNFLGGVLQ